MRTKPEKKPLLRDWVFAIASIVLAPKTEFAAARPVEPVAPAESAVKSRPRPGSQHAHRGALATNQAGTRQSPAIESARCFQRKIVRLVSGAAETTRRQ